MRKLQLNIDELMVESFAPRDSPRLRGTVVAHETEACGATHCVTCPPHETCGWWHTCDDKETCFTRDRANTCFLSCGFSCGE
jgi:hypothetical protein